MITEATPIVIPSSVRSERSRFASTPCTAMRSASNEAHAGTRSWVVACGRGIGVGDRSLADIRDDLAVGELDHALRALGDVALVGDHHDRPAERVQAGEDVEHLLRRRAVEVSGRLVGEHDRRVGDDRARDRGALLLAAGELRRSVQRAVGEPDGRDRLERARASLGPVHPRVDQRQLDVPHAPTCAESG